jgi:hypothetical protein
VGGCQAECLTLRPASPFGFRGTCARNVTALCASRVTNGVIEPCASLSLRPPSRHPVARATFGRVVLRRYRCMGDSGSRSLRSLPGMTDVGVIPDSCEAKPSLILSVIRNPSAQGMFGRVLGRSGLRQAEALAGDGKTARRGCVRYSRLSRGLAFGRWTGDAVYREGMSGAFLAQGSRSEARATATRKG